MIAEKSYYRASNPTASPQTWRGKEIAVFRVNELNPFVSLKINNNKVGLGRPTKLSDA